MLGLGPRQLAFIDHSILRPLLAKHTSPSFFSKVYSYSRESFLKELSKQKLEVVELPTKYQRTLFNNKLVFRNDLGNAAGLDKDGLLLDFNYKIGAGFALVGTVLNKAHTGNIFPCFGKKCNPWVPLHFSASALNSLGLPSKGVDFVKEQILKFRNSRDLVNFPIGVSLMGHPLSDDQAKLAGILESIEKLENCIDFFEINESCPNTTHDASFDSLNQRISVIVSKCRSLTNYKPICIKLGDFGNLEETLEFYAKAGVDAISFTNTSKDYYSFAPKLDRRDLAIFSDYTAKHQGGISGRLIKESTCLKIQEAAQYINSKGLKLKLIHVGGIENSIDMQNSRNLNRNFNRNFNKGYQEDIVILRQWYTGFMQALSKERLERIYLRVLS